ncbi:MAG: hypothetical protein E4H13_02430 [Calditrichales bacterium]|nr:MAG: hypothetical protein E4H13_02430 [Calditrichales bacterium]
MKYTLYIIALICLALISCRPSARFSASNNEVQSRTERTEQADRYQPAEKNASIGSNDSDGYFREWLGTPYLYGGMSRQGVDCSGLSSLVFRDLYDVDLPRTAEEQYRSGEKIRDAWRKEGDLVFFRNVRGHGIDHVGIYIGNNRFIHASQSAGVIISQMDEDYYRIRYVGTCRYGDTAR